MASSNEVTTTTGARVAARLLAIEGPVRGAIWDINAPRMVLGRSKDCEVRIADLSVSRRHCELHLDDDAIAISDFGSLNAVLLNGRPCEASPVSIGDRISIGNTVLLVTTADTLDYNTPGSNRHGTTLGLAQSSYAIENVESMAKQGDLSTARDIAAVYVFSRRLAAHATLENALAFLEAGLKERFAPEAYWYVRVSREDEAFPSTRADGEENMSSFPVTAVRRAIGEKRGILESLTEEGEADGASNLVLVAPLVFAEEVIGCIVLCADDRDSEYDERDLDFLVAIGISAAPILKALGEVERLRAEVNALKDRVGTEYFVGSHPSVKRVRMDTLKAARGELNVLIQGETGTGKELIARMVHAHSERSDAPFIPLNCASIPDHLLESELFGYEKGAFTGADRARSGLVELAHGGTLFLDEIGDLSGAGQASLLRVIEDGTFYSVGGRDQKQVDVRFVAATNRDLAAMIGKEEFRSDLFHRLAAFELRIPPLRDRVSDIPALVNHFLTEDRESDFSQAVSISDDALAYLAAHPWPGNVRELRNVIDQGLVNSNGALLEARHLERSEEPSKLGETPADALDESASLEDVERAHIAKVLEACAWNLAEASRILGLSRSTLYNKITKYGLRS